MEFKQIISIHLLIGITTGSYAEVPSEELRGLWLATVDNKDWPSSPHLTVQQQQEELLNYIDIMSMLNMNCLFFHVRPAGDALYMSDLEPWSVYLTGQQGVPPDPLWDPLAFVVEHAHAHNIQVHAWLNPFRAKYHDSTPSGLYPTHMAMMYPEYAYPYGDDLWMDPGASVVVKQLLRVVNDILSRYLVDGIHIDDYFYPYPVKNLPFPDNKTYQEYIDKGGTSALDDWRRNNINSLIKVLSSLVSSYDKTFSISPNGSYRPGQQGGMPPPLKGFDPYSTIFADSKLWLEMGWCDWFIPQIYTTILPPDQSYALVLDWWLNVNARTSRKYVFAGTAVFMLAPPFAWDLPEIVAQVQISRRKDFRDRGSLGNVFFEGSTLRDDVKNIRSVLHQLYQNKSIIPDY